MTATATHLWRLLKWGRTLARHGALRGIERDPNTPAAVRRLCRIARFGARTPDTPAYADALQAIGPPAIKFGQTLATRPDLIGEAAAADLVRLQDAVPPLPFAAVEKAMAASFGRPLSALFASIDPVPVGAASIAQVHRAVTTEGVTVAVKVLRPGIEEEFARAIDTYEWTAAHLEAMGGELKRLQPRLVIETFKRWTARELDLRREAASASELAEAMTAEPDFIVPKIDWQRTTGRVMTLEWIDGIKLSNRAALIAAGHDPARLAHILVHAFLRQAIAEGFFHADLHQGNLFAIPGGKIAAIDFGIMGRIDRRARVWLAEILYGLITGNYRRVAEIHFEAGYVPPHHNVGEFATALRAVGEPMRGLAVKDMSVGNMLDGLFNITRDFDMKTQPHLLLLQKTMVMVEGVATALDPDINMWETSAPFVREWIRTELGPEAFVADRLVTDLRTLSRLPQLIRNIERHFP
ncbi:MAG: 2-polyprenylphenol 6-hydroxylase, partial [Sphingomonas hengshuiensis]